MELKVKVNNYVFKVNLDLEFSYDEEKESLEFLGANAKSIDKVDIKKNNYKIHQLSDTQVNFGIITMGSKGIGELIPLSDKITVKFYRKDKLISQKECKTHSKTRGRVDGLTSIYKENKDIINSSTILNLEYDPTYKVLKIKA